MSRTRSVPQWDLRSPALARSRSTSSYGAYGSRRRRPRRRSNGAGRFLLGLVALVVLFSGWRWWSGNRAHAPTVAQGATSGSSGAASSGVAGTLASALSSAADAIKAPLAAPAAAPAFKGDTALQSLVERLVDDDNGDTSVYVRSLRSGAGATYHDHEVFPAASLAKLPILYEVYRQLDSGQLRPDALVAVTSDDITDGAGVLQAREGERLTIEDLVDLAVRVSDNTAARMLLRSAGGVEAVNRTMADLGLAQTRLYADSRPNTISAADAAALLMTVATRSGSPSGGAPAPGSLGALLALPQAQAWMAHGVPSSVPVAHKSGQLPGVRHDAAIVYAPRGAYIVVGLTKDLADQDDAETFLEQLARETYEYFGK